MAIKGINFWAEGDISTTRVVSRLLDDLVDGVDVSMQLLEHINWQSLSSNLNIFCRVCSPQHAWLPSFLRNNNISYIYYLDDNFWRIQGEGDLVAYYRRPKVVASLDEFVRNASLVIVHTEALFSFISRRFPGVRCEILPAPFDFSLPASFVNKKNLQLSVGSIVGYAGGYKKQEFDFLERVIVELGSSRPDIRFEFIGGISDKLLVQDNVQWFPGFSDYSKFIEFKVSRQWSVGLAPLMANEFNASKTNNKFREYGGCGIAGIYSASSPFIECVSNGDTGLLVENETGAWIEAIEALVDKPELRENIVRQASNFVESHCSHKAIATQWIEVLTSVPAVQIGSQAIASRLRTNYFIFHMKNNMPEQAAVVECASKGALYWRRFKETLEHHLPYINPKIIVGLVALITLININIYLLRGN